MQASLLLRQQHAASVVAQNHRGRPLAAPQDRPSPGASAAMPSSSFGASAKAGIPKQITVTSDEMKPAATPTDVDDMLTLPFGEEDEDEDEFVLVTVGGGGKVNGAPSVSGHGTEQVIPRRYDSKLLRPRPSCLDGGDGVGSVRQLSFDGTPIPSRAPPDRRSVPPHGVRGPPGHETRRERRRRRWRGRLHHGGRVPPVDGRFQ